LKIFLHARSKRGHLAQIIVETMILDKIRSTMRAKMEREHGLYQHPYEGFTDEGAAEAAELESQS